METMVQHGITQNPTANISTATLLAFVLIAFLSGADLISCCFFPLYILCAQCEAGIDLGTKII